MKNIIYNIIISWTSFFKIQKLSFKKKEIIFYLENNSDWLYLKFFYSSLIKSSKNILIISSDTGYNFNDCKVDYFIGRGSARTLFFRLISSKLFITTMTDLDNFYLKKSFNTDTYVYIFHSLVSTNRVYRESAFDNYEILLCPTEYHFNEIRKTEEVYGLKKKKLIKYGYPRINEIVNMKNQTSINFNKIPKILIAPTWGKSSLLNYEIIFLIDLLLKSNFEVHLRLHPMSYRKLPKIVSILLETFEKYQNKNFFYHKNIYNNDIMFSCDHLITEWSGTAFEFAFANLKPVFFIDTPPKINNNKWFEINQICFEEVARDKIGYIIEVDKLDQILEKISLYNENSNYWKNKIADFRKELIYNYDDRDYNINIDDFIL